MTIYEQFQYLKNRPSEINEHLEDLYELAKKCQHITEFGTGHGVALWAFLAAKPKRVVSYDYRPQDSVALAITEAANEGINFEYKIISTLDIKEIEETDFLFVDTLHTYNQVKQELVHADKVRKFIAFHDTVLFGENGERGEEGITRAITEFLAANQNWKIIMRKENCCGLIVIERINNELE